MQAGKVFFALSLLLACGMGALLVGCANSWYLAAAKKGDTVELCLSNGPQCPQSGGVSPSSISVYRQDNMRDNLLVWDTGPINPLTDGTISGVVTWGIPPKNWTNGLTPPKLKCGTPYLLNPGAHYFALKCDGTVVVFEATQLEEFFRENATPVGNKTQR
jgi:hypothetical protein